MKNFLFAATAVPLFAMGAQSTPMGAYLTVEQTCAYVSDSAAEFLQCDERAPVDEDCQGVFCEAVTLPVKISVERNTQAFDPDEMPMWCDRAQCWANTGPYVITMDYSGLRAQAVQVQ